MTQVLSMTQLIAELGLRHLTAAMDLRRAIAGLDPLPQAIVRLFGYCGVPIDEIADALGLEPEHVRAILETAAREMQDHLVSPDLRPAA